LVIDGGNVVSDGSVAILTDKIFQENPDRTSREIKSELQDALKVKQIVVIPQEPHDPIGHSDGMVRFISKGRVVANDYSGLDQTFDKQFRAVLERKKLAIERLPYVPPSIINNRIPSAVGNYVNFLRVADLIVVPSYGLPTDGRAISSLNRLLPHADIVPLPCEDIAADGGVLNCVSITVRLPKKRAHQAGARRFQSGGKPVAS
jgi:agmatine deiminase